MASKTSWGWKIYFFVYLLLMVSRVTTLLDPRSFNHLYYHILISFNPPNQIFYYLALINAAVSLIYLLPIYLYVFRVRFLKNTVWQGLFAAKLGTDLVGHSYEIKYLTSFLMTDPWIGLLALFPLLVFLGPAYFAGFRYAFFRKNLFPGPERDAKASPPNHQR